jgi:hypothetical protein
MGGNQIPYIEEEQITQWPKEKAQKDKQRSTKYTHNTKDRDDLNYDRFSLIKLITTLSRWEGWDPINRFNPTTF